MTRPITDALVASSSLRAGVRGGLGALEKSHRRLLQEDVRTAFAESLEIDGNLLKGREQSNRWDYLLGHKTSSHIVGLEPHSAATKEVSAVIRKRDAAIEQLRPHLRAGKKVSEWYWVASGRVDFVPHDKMMRRLEQAGITFVGGALGARHILPWEPLKKKQR